MAVVWRGRGEGDRPCHRKVNIALVGVGEGVEPQRGERWGVDLATERSIFAFLGRGEGRGSQKLGAKKGS